MSRSFQLKSLPVECLRRGAFQPREAFDEDSLQELASSIKSQGLIEPLVVREYESNQYEIIAGERRWRAALRARLSEVPCLISDYTNEQAAAVTLIENIQRQDLNPLEEATGYQRLLQDFHFQQDEVAALVGKSRSHVANLLRLLTLCCPVQTQIRARQLSLGHARMLVGLSESQQVELARVVQTHHWSVRRLEKEVRSLKRTGFQPEKSISHDVKQLQIFLSEQFGAPVEITGEPDKSGWLKIKFYNNDTLAGLLEKLGMRYD